MFDNISNENISKTKRTFKYISRFLRKYLTLLVFSIFIYGVPIFLTKDPFTGFYVTKSYVVVGIILTLLMFYSLNRLVTVYNEEIALRFINSDFPIKSLKEKFRFIFAQKENRLELIAFSVAYLILPLEFTSPCLNWLFLGENGGFGGKLVVMLGLFPILFLIYMLGHLSAIKYWDTQERIKVHDRANMNEKEIGISLKKEKKDYRRMFRSLIFAYFVGSLVLMFYVPRLLASIGPFLMVFLEPASLIIIALLVITPFVVRTIRAYRKRKKFIEELKKVCTRKRYVLSKIKYPYKSLFTPYKGESFNVRIGDRRYSCKLIASKKYGNPIFLMPKGIGAWVINIRFLRIELLSYTKSFNFGWEADCKKVLIVNPVPVSVLLPQGKKYTELDNGDIVDGYEFYTATGFLNALERDVIDID